MASYGPLAQQGPAQVRDVRFEGDAHNDRGVSVPRRVPGVGEFVKMPLLGGGRVLLDDDGADVVFVFKVEARDLPAGDVERPAERAAEIFARNHNPDSHDVAHKATALFEGMDSVSHAQYNQVIRKVLQDVLANNGIRVQDFTSIDGDEVFFKLDLCNKRGVMDSTAFMYQYKLPIKAEVYQELETTEPMLNDDGDEVFAYETCSPLTRHHLQDFLHIDEGRLLEQFLTSWMHLEKLSAQDVVQKIFFGARHEDIEALNEEWSGLRHWWKLPAAGVPDEVRDYFGERVAFFFLWYGTFCRALGVLAIFGLISALRKIPAFGLDLITQRYIQIGFAFILMGWVAIFNKSFLGRQARHAQKWGTQQEWEVGGNDRAEFDPGLEFTAKLTFYNFVARSVMALFMLGFVGGVAIIGYCSDNRLGNGFFREHGHFLTVIWIKVGGWVWGKLAPKLTNMTNPRTQDRWDEQLAWMLATVKIFVALYPFYYMAFIKRIVIHDCQSTFMAAATDSYSKLLGPGQWPEGIDMSDPVDQQLGWLEHWHFERGGQHCIMGCFPQVCHRVDGTYACVTNCVSDLEGTLLPLFITNMATTAVFVLIPMFLTYREVKKEKEKAEAGEAHGSKEFTLLQLQAKCYETAKYEYQSWGGSYVEDFLTVATDFTLLACWSLVLPVMSVVCFVVQVVTYRLLAFRMVNVTCRPHPRGAQGIGIWTWIFEKISLVAVVTNVLYMVIVMYPIRNWGDLTQTECFIIFEHSMLMMMFVLAVSVPNEPRDVRAIQDFNLHIRNMLARAQHVEELKKLSFAEKLQLSRVDITPRDEQVDSGEDH